MSAEGLGGLLMEKRNITHLVLQMKDLSRDDRLDSRYLFRDSLGWLVEFNAKFNSNPKFSRSSQTKLRVGIEETLR